MTSRRRQDDAQYSLDFTSGFDESMALLRADLEAIDPGQLGESEYSWGLIAEVLQAIWCHAGASVDGWCHASMANLVERCSVEHERMSVHQFKRYRRYAANHDLVSWRKSHRGVNAVAWRVDRGEIARLAELGRSAPRCASAPPDAPRRPAAPPHRGNPNPLSSKPKTPRPPFPERAAQTVASAAGDPRAAAGGGWGALILELERLDVGLAADTAGEIARRGGGPEDLAALLAAYRAQPGAWGPGAIVTRVQRWRPGQDPTKHWPPESAAYQAAERRRLRQDALRRSAEQRQARQQQRDQEQRQRDADEAEYGPLVDALGRDAAEELLRAAYPKAFANIPARMIRAWQTGQPAEGVTRSVLITALKEGQTVAQEGASASG